MNYFYGRVRIHPVFLDDLGRLGVEFAKPPQRDGEAGSDAEVLQLRIRYPASAHAAILRLASYGGAEIEIVALSVSTDAQGLQGGNAKKNAALVYYHEYGIESAATEGQREVHRRALERIGAAWTRSIRQTAQDPNAEIGSDPGALP